MLFLSRVRVNNLDNGAVAKGVQAAPPEQPGCIYAKKARLGVAAHAAPLTLLLDVRFHDTFGLSFHALRGWCLIRDDRPQC